MELIVLTRRRRIQRALHLGGGTILLALVAGFALLAGAVWTGAQLAGPATAPDPRPDLYASALRAAA